MSQKCQPGARLNQAETLALFTRGQVRTVKSMQMQMKRRVIYEKLFCITFVINYEYEDAGEAEENGAESAVSLS